MLRLSIGACARIVGDFRAGVDRHGPSASGTTVSVETDAPSRCLGTPESADTVRDRGADHDAHHAGEGPGVSYGGAPSTLEADEVGPNEWQFSFEDFPRDLALDEFSSGLRSSHCLHWALHLNLMRNMKFDP
jgi:hypothetical protein